MNSSFQFDKNSSEKFYVQLYKIFKQRILTGELKPGDKMPSIRQIATKYQLNFNTILQAYDLLENENYIIKTVGKGTYVSDGYHYNLNEKNRPLLENFSSKEEDNLLEQKQINFAYGTPHSSFFPLESFQRFSVEIFLTEDNSIYTYQHIQGLPTLRKLICDRVEKEDIFVNPEEIIVTSGTQNSINIIYGLFAKNQKFSVALSEVTYPNALNIFEPCTIFSIPLLRDGWDLDYFEELLKRKRIDVVYEVFNYQNPTGIVWSSEKKKRLLELSFEYDFYIIEDDCFSEFYHFGEKVTSLKSFDKVGSERVFYLRTYSKTIMPCLGVAFIMPPPEFREQINLIKHAFDTTTSGINQKILEKFIESSAYEDHLKILRKNIHSNYTLMKSLLKKIPELELFDYYNGGLFIFAKLNKNVDEEGLYIKARERNLKLFPSSMFSSKKENCHLIRLSYAAATLEEIEEGCKILKEIIKG